MRNPLINVFGLLALSTALGGCGIIYTVKDPHLHEDALATVTEFKQCDPDLQRFFDTAHGYAVFPSVGWSVYTGRRFGKGELLIKGHWDGNCSVFQEFEDTPRYSQSFSELIFFKDAVALDRFESNQLALGTRASAVDGSSNSAANPDYRNGVLVLVLTATKGSLTLTPTIGGQKFNYKPNYETHSAFVMGPDY